MNSFLTVDEVVASAITIIPEATQKDKNIFRNWVFLAERQIGSSIVSRKNATDITVTNFSFPKPFDCISVRDIALFDSAGEEVLFKHTGSGKQITDKEYVDNINRYVTVREDDGFFYLSSNGSNVVKANMRYYGFPTDSDDNLKIPEIHTFAIMMFLKYMMALRDSEKRLDIKDLAGLWEKEKRQARARTNMPSELEAQFIARRFSSMIDKMIKEY